MPRYNFLTSETTLWHRSLHIIQIRERTENIFNISQITDSTLQHSIETDEMTYEGAFRGSTRPKLS